MNIRIIWNKFEAFALSVAALLMSRLDMGAGGAFLFVCMFAIFIFVEMFYIRKTLINVYADAITEHRFLLFFLRNRLVNFLITSIFSVYLAFYLFIYVNVSTINDLILFVIAGILLSFLTAPFENAASGITREKPSKVFSRVGVMFIVVLVTVLLDGLYHAYLPVDSRFSEAFDINIPLYVIDDIEHSYVYLQHFLRTVLYLKYNIQSIGLSEKVGVWYEFIRFLLLLSPTPYIAYTLLLLSFTAVKKINLEINR